MPGSEDTIRVIDRELVGDDFAWLKEQLVSVKEEIKSFSGIALGSKTTADAGQFRTQAAQIAESLSRIKQLEGELEQARSKNSTIQKTRTDEELRASVKTREETRQRTAAIKAEGDAYKQLALAYNQAAAEAKKLQATALASGLQADKEAADQASAAANRMAIALKAIDRSVGDNRRNVGDYIGAVSILEKELQSVTAKIEQMTAAGQAGSAEMVQLKEQQQALSVITSQMSRGFLSLNQEVRQAERALGTMRAAGLESTEAFEQMQIAVIKAHKELNEFNKGQQLLENPAAGLQSAVLAARGLAGAYAVGYGAVNLLSDGNEKLEKELNKMVAVMSILQGLNEVHELLERKGAIATLFNISVMKIKNFVITGSVDGIKQHATATEADTAAVEENSIAQETGIAAAEENTAATVANAEAQEAAAVATTGVSTAMKVLRGALIATGIGALVFVIIEAVGWLKELGQTAQKAAEDEIKLADAINEVNAALLGTAKIQNDQTDKAKKGLEQELALAEKSGKNYYDIMVIKQKIAAIDQADAANSLTAVTGVNNVSGAYDKANKKVAEYGAEIKRLQGFIEDAEGAREYLIRQDKSTKEVDKSIENNKKLLAEKQKTYEAFKKAQEDFDKATDESRELTTERDKFSNQERIELAVEHAKAIKELAQSTDQQILNDERSSRAQRLAALADNFDQEEKFIEKEHKARLSAAGLTAADIEKINLDEDTKLIENKRNKAEALRKMDLEFEKIDRDAIVERHKNELEDQIKINEALLTDEKLSHQQRLTILAENNMKARVIAGEEMMKSLDNTRLGAEERKAIISKYDSEILALDLKFNKDRQQEAKKARQDQIDDLIAAGETEKAQVLKNQALKEIEIDKKGGTPEAMERARQQAAFEANRDILLDQAKTDEALVNSTKEGTKERAAAELKLAQDTAALSKLLTDKKIKDKKEEQGAIIALAKQGEEAAAAFVKGSYEHELNMIQRQIDRNNIAKEKQVANIETARQAGSLSAQQAAAEQIELNAKVTANNEALARKQRDIKVKEAEFDKAKAVLDIIANTAVNATKFSWNPVIEAEIIATGAAELAAVLGRPVPKYEKGRRGGPAEMAIVHPGEMIVGESGGVMTPEKPALTFLPAGADVRTAAEVNQMRMQGILSNFHVERDGTIEKKIDHLIQVTEKGNRAQVRAIQGQKPPVIIIHNDAAFTAMIKEYCS